MTWEAVILTEATDYAHIRSLLGVDEYELTDTVIEQAPFLPTAEGIVKQAITDYATLTGDNLIFLKAGTAALCAALLCQKLERDEMTDFRVADYWEHGTKMDWRSKAKALMNEAARALGAISTRTFMRRTALAVAGPTRSRTNVPTSLEEWIEKVVPGFVDWAEGSGG